MVERVPIAASGLAAAVLLTIACAQAVAQDVQIRSCPPAAASPTREQVQVGVRTARNRGFLWRITNDGAQFVSNSPAEPPALPERIEAVLQLRE
jgi:phenylpropionate dioxygenase-like ring-hydroxylating dioxygenase large terminal subunit